MTLRFAEFLSDGTRVRELVLDSKVCDCCQTAVVNTPKGLLAAYRDRSDNEFRDISLVRPEALKPEPRDFSKDGWKINACPVNGPALAARGDVVSSAWFTMGGGKARVKAAVSNDGGDTFSPPIEVDATFPTGRVDIAMLPSGVSLLSWLGRGEGGPEIKAALLGTDGVAQARVQGGCRVHRPRGGLSEARAFRGRSCLRLDRSRAHPGKLDRSASFSGANGRDAARSRAVPF